MRDEPARPRERRESQVGMSRMAAGGAGETIFVCSCEDTFSPDAGRIGPALGDGIAIRACTHLCGTEQELVTRAAEGGGAITIACKQEEPGFRALLDDLGFEGRQTYVDIRDSAGWSSEGRDAEAKMAALLAAGRLPPPAIPFVTLESKGVILICGRDAVAIEAGRLLQDDLDVTVMLRNLEAITPPASRAFPILKGRVRSLAGVLGAFELTCDDVGMAKPSSRARLEFEGARTGATSRCDIVLDLTGGAPMVAADGLRDGYLRADPGSPQAVAAAIAKARDLVGTFDKPKYVEFKPDLCAHSRNRISGCTRCLEVCPTGAITPAGDHVAIDPLICAGCGGCASVCPTGAATYALPAPDALMRRMRILLRTYRAAGGREAILLIHDAPHGLPIIEALARFGDGLPARVLPISVNEVTQIGIGEIAAAFAFGAAGVALLASAKPKHDPLPLVKLAGLVENLLPPLGHAPGAFARIETDDPDQMLAALRAMPGGGLAEPASFEPRGAKRQVAMLALREWQAHAVARPERIALPAGAPFGTVKVEAAGCTLCLACVSTCPVDALTANPERPELRFQEDLCVQCGLCAATCPEKVITLEPRLDFAAIAAPPRVLKQEEPYPCDRCGKLFGTKATIEKIKAKLAGAHWMYSGQNADRVKLIGYCEDCRMETAALAGFDPYGKGVPERPRVKTSEDYFREREEDRGE